MTARAETAREKARRLMDEVDRGSKSHYSPGEVKTILNTIAQSVDTLENICVAEDAGGCRAPVAVKRVRRGDVFIGKTVGGKVRPWVVLRVAGEVVYATPLSTSADQLSLGASECRYWPGSYIGGALVSFRMEDAVQEVTRPFTARKQLAEVEKHLLGILKKSERKKPNLRVVTKMLTEEHQ